MNGPLITAAILLLFALLFFANVRLYFSYDGGAGSFQIGYLFLRIKPGGKKKKKALADKKDEGAEKKVRFKFKLKELKPRAKALLNVAGQLIKQFYLKLLKRITVSGTLAVCVAGEDAYGTAVSYASAGPAAYGVYGAAQKLIRFKKFDLVVLPDFCAERVAVRADIRVRIRLFFLAALLVSSAYILFKNRKLFKEIFKNDGEQKK